MVIMTYYDLKYEIWKCLFLLILVGFSAFLYIS